MERNQNTTAHCALDPADKDHKATDPESKIHRSQTDWALMRCTGQTPLFQEDPTVPKVSTVGYQTPQNTPSGPTEPS